MSCWYHLYVLKLFNVDHHEVLRLKNYQYYYFCYSTLAPQLRDSVRGQPPDKKQDLSSNEDQAVVYTILQNQCSNQVKMCLILTSLFSYVVIFH